MKYLKFNIILFAIVLLSGCSTVRKLDKSDEYKNAPSHEKRIILPSDMNRAAIENYYPIPKTYSNDKRTDVALLPPRINLSE